MTKIQELESKLNSLYLLRNDKSQKSIIDILDKNIDELQKELNIEKSKKNHSTKKELRIKLSNLLEQKKNADCIKSYTDLTKKIREVRFNLKELEGELKHLTIHQINSILKVIQKNSKFILRDKLLILLGFELGLRASEVLNLKLSDVYFESNEIFCRRLKGSNTN